MNIMQILFQHRGPLFTMTEWNCSSSMSSTFNQVTFQCWSLIINMNINHLNEEYFRHWAEETKSFPISGSLIPLSKEANSSTASNTLCANTSTRQRKQIRQHPFSGDPLGSLGPAQSALKLKVKASNITQHSLESRQHQNFNSCCKSNLSC